MNEVIVSEVGGHEIRTAYSFRFGNLFTIGNTGVSYANLADAEQYAREHPKSAHLGPEFAADPLFGEIQTQGARQ